MDQRPRNTSEVLTFPSKQLPRVEADLIDQTGKALIAMLREAGNVPHDDVNKARAVADKLSIHLKAAEDRIAQLQGEVANLRGRALRAEQWLETIKAEIQSKLIRPRQP